MDDVDKLENYIPSCEVADIIGRDVRTVQKLTKDGTLTCEKKKNKNLYNLYTVVREYCDYVAKLGKKKIFRTANMMNNLMKIISQRVLPMVILRKPSAYNLLGQITTF